MDFGVICPIKMMQKVAKLSNTSMYLYHLFEDYHYLNNFLMDNNYRILDNGVFELGKLPSEEDYIRRIIHLSPEEIIAPDTPQNYFDTLKKTNNFVKKYRTKIGRINIQGVVQARNLREAINCYLSYSENPLIDVIGFPFRMNLNIKGCLCGRKNLIEILAEKGLLKNHKPIHLLGLKSINEIIEIAKAEVIRSCDSSKFYRHATEGRVYGNKLPPHGLYGPLNFNEESNERCLEILKRNLEVLKCKIKE